MNSIKTKLLTSFLLVSLIPLIALGMTSYFISKDSLVNSKKEHLKQIVDSAYILAENLQIQVINGSLSEEEAQEMLREALVGEKQADQTRVIPEKSPRIGQEDYFFAYDKEIRAVMHPKVFEGEVKNDPNVEGKYVNKEMYDQKEGYYSFMWQNPGEDKARPKMAYLRYFEPWDWVLVMGSYYDGFYNESELIRNITIIIILVGMVVVALVSLFITTRFTKNITEMKIAVEAFGDGDFTKRVKVIGKDEIGNMGEMLNHAVSQVQFVISKVMHSSNSMQTSANQLSVGVDHLDRASEEIAHSVEEVASGSEEQADNLQNLSGYMEELVASFDETALNVNHVNHVVIKASEVSKKGQERIEESVQQMNVISKSVERIQEVMHHLNENTKKISNFVTVISEISSQTNLLALNAAIEAARAGEFGRGFAVVADEVRKLAEQSNRSAEEIKGIITNVLIESEQSQEIVQDSSKAVLIGIDVVKDTGQIFAEIHDYVSEVATEVTKITLTITEVNKGAQGVSNSVSDLGAFNEETNSHTQNVAAAIEEKTAMTKEINMSMKTLAGQANELYELSKKFTV
ncbi:methyl-accepting chemotaxis protein [Sporosarcina limicola]|uniref:Methyl-accepting chemotaxis protein n=1 Tax=Sporosarcina limicola TaxID=34101 RepID=A0A927MJ18_9BACL|nr:methyl-accepting chemotaxis protein [Sporosarcina limicola]MBE1554047.1 methyl-accepting chemotaxis protein [Sporosarcina limicola]